MPLSTADEDMLTDARFSTIVIAMLKARGTLNAVKDHISLLIQDTATKTHVVELCGQYTEELEVIWANGVVSDNNRDIIDRFEVCAKVEALQIYAASAIRAPAAVNEPTAADEPKI